METDRLFLWLALVPYAGAVLFAAVHLVRDRRHTRSVTLPLVAAGFALQTTGLYLRGQTIGACPLGNLTEILQFITWSSVFLFLIVGPVFRVHLLGFFTCLFACLLGLASLSVPAWDRPHSRLLFGGDPLVELHAAVAIFSYGVFGLLAVVAIMFLVQYTSLQNKLARPFFSFFPPITILDRLASRLLATGVLLLTFSFATGLLVLTADPTPYLATKLTAVFLLWLGYGFVLVQRLRQAMPPNRQAVAHLVLFVLALASLWPVDHTRGRDTGGRDDSRALSPEGTP